LSRTKLELATANNVISKERSLKNESEKNNERLEIILKEKRWRNPQLH